MLLTNPPFGKRAAACVHMHTLLRLPSGLFYIQDMKENVLFFGK
jgi:hypothetical protein